MAETPTVKSKVDQNFETQIRQLRTRAEKQCEAYEKTGQTQWTMPEKQPPGDDAEEWDGDLFGIEGLSKPFIRTEANDDFEEAVKDADAPGVAGDLIITTLQADYMATMERAFRSRHTMRRPRTMAHMTARLKGHGSERGTLTQAHLEYVRNLIERAKAESGG
jgi:hypothetical protein